LHLFIKKEDFGIKALQFYTAQQIERIREILGDESRSPVKRLREFYQNNIDFNIDEQCRKGCLVGNMAQEMGGLSEAIGDQTEASLKEIIALISNCISEGQSLGEIRNDYGADDLADYLHNSFYGFLLRSKAGRDEFINSNLRGCCVILILK